MDGVVWRTESDSSQIRTDMAATAANVQGSMSRMGSAISGVESRHENLLRSNHRVAGSMRGLARDIATTGNVVDSVAASMESLARATNLGLGTLIGLEVGAVLISKLVKAGEESEKLKEKMKELAEARPTALFNTFEDITKQVKDLREALGHLNKETSSEYWGEFYNFMKSLVTGKGGEFIHEQMGLRDRLVESLSAARGEHAASIMQKTGLVGLKGSQKELAELEIEHRRLVHEYQLAGETQSALAEQKRYVALKQQINEKVAEELADEKTKARVKALDAVAGLPDKFSNEYSMQTTWAGMEARRAKREEELARESLLKYNDPAGAQRHMDEAKRIRGAAGLSLGDDFISQMNNVPVLQKIEENTRRLSMPETVNE